MTSPLLPFPDSLCHDCAHLRYVRTATTTFLLCHALPDKYPPQPVRACLVFARRAQGS